MTTILIDELYFKQKKKKFETKKSIKFYSLAIIVYYSISSSKLEKNNIFKHKINICV